MLKFRISESSGRLPAVLFLIELTVFLAAVLAVVYVGPFAAQNPSHDGLFLWLLRALVFSGALIVCMALLKLYQGRPRERIGTAMLRLTASFLLAGGLLQLVYLLLPSMRLEPAPLGAALVLSFFFLGTVRPVFLDSVTERRGRRRTDLTGDPVRANDESVAEMTPEEIVASLARNDPKTTTLTGQHRITRRGL